MKIKKVIQLSTWFRNNENLIEIIRSGQIRVNNEVVTNPDNEVNYGSIVTYQDHTFEFRKEINLVMYKPVGYVCANKDNLHPTVISLLARKYQSYKWSIAGRLDLDVSGVLILTTSGKINQQIANPKFKVQKTYIATTTSKLSTMQINSLKDYLLLQDQDNTPYLSKFEIVEKLSDFEVAVTLSQGRYHQVKNSFIAIKNPLAQLKRVRVGNMELCELKPGEVYEFEFKDFLSN